MGSESQYVSDLVLKARFGQAGVDDRVIQTLHSQGACRKFCREGRIAITQVMLTQHLRQDQVGIGVIETHCTEHIQGGKSRGIDSGTFVSHPRNTP